MLNDCADGDMRDLLPGYVNGTLSGAERAAVARHLQTCVDCAAETRLIETAARAYPAPGVDTERLVRALSAAPRRARPRGSAGSAWRIAAAIGIVAIGTFSVVALRQFFGAASPRHAAGAPAPAAGAAVAVTASLPRPALADSSVPSSVPSASPGPRAGSLSFGGGLSDLTDDQLDTLLGELDTLDALPSAEPEPTLTPIVPPADGGHNAR
jgi:anti-sigma factor RsiW